VRGVLDRWTVVSSSLGFGSNRGSDGRLSPGLSPDGHGTMFLRTHVGDQVDEGAVLTLSEMFSDDETRTFEQQRDEVLALVAQAADLEGPDQYLRRAVHRCRRAHNAEEFDEAYESLVEAIVTAPLTA
jgi:hypothetical protein